MSRSLIDKVVSNQFIGHKPRTCTADQGPVHLPGYLTCKSDLQSILPISANFFRGSQSELLILPTVNGTCIAVHKPSCIAASRL